MVVEQTMVSMDISRGKVVPALIFCAQRALKISALNQKSTIVDVSR